MMFCMTLQNAPRRGALQEEPEPEAAVGALREDPITMDETATSSSAIPDDATHQMDFFNSKKLNRSANTRRFLKLVDS